MNDESLRKRITTLARGQVISILIAGTGIFASLLSGVNANYPTLLSTCNYGLLAIYLIRVYHRQQSWQTMVTKEQLWKYALVAFMDVQANFLVILAYQYTSITSIMLLDCFTIPSAMMFSYFFLSYRYSLRHILGAFTCIVGLICIVIADSILNRSGSSSNALLGDLLCLSGSFLYAATNVFQEHFVKSDDKDKYLGFLGIFGTLFSFCQFWAYDYSHFSSGTLSSPFNILCFAGFVLCLFAMYSQTAQFLEDSDATLFNLSLLTSDVYAVLFAYLMYSQIISFMYPIAFVLVSIGLYVYHSEKSPKALGCESCMQLPDSSEHSGSGSWHYSKNTSNNGFKVLNDDDVWSPIVMEE